MLWSQWPIDGLCMPICQKEQSPISRFGLERKSLIPHEIFWWTLTKYCQERLLKRAWMNPCFCTFKQTKNHENQIATQHVHQHVLLLQLLIFSFFCLVLNVDGGMKQVKRRVYVIHLQKSEHAQQYLKLFKHNQLCRLCFTTFNEGRYKLNFNLLRDSNGKYIGYGKYKHFFGNLRK